MYSALKRLLVGTPLASSDEHHTRLGRPTALTVFASDAISSTAYATEEILLVLVPVMGMAALDDLVPISIVVAFLLLIVISSYRQTIFAYPNGGGSYVVSRENLGEKPALVAGASLLVDYVLTVAVSVSAGIAAITSAFTSLQPYQVHLCLAAILLMMLANLRGTKESGRLFAPPVYTYVVSLVLLIGYGLFRVFVQGLSPMPVNEEALAELAQSHGTAFGPDGSPLFVAAGAFLVLRAFSSGAVALTGVEAISNGVPAFKKPESRNAASTLVAMGLILGSAFLGLSILAHNLQPTVYEAGSPNYETLLSTMGAYVYGGKNVLYYILQFSTFAILILAANTAFADFPRVSSIIAADGYLPRQLSNRGDRLVYSNGIVVLSVVAGILILAFGGVTSALIPLYAVGVFTGFTLSQAGMVRHHKEERQPGWQRKQAFNAFGAVATFIVLCVVVVSKFAIGAWIPVVLIPCIVTLFLSIKRHYNRVAAALRVPAGYHPEPGGHTIVILVGNVHRGVLDAIAYARSLRPDRVVAVSVAHSAEDEERIRASWARYEVPIDLTVVDSPYRELSGPIMEFIDELDHDHPNQTLTVMVPEFVLSHWWEQLLHNQSALVLRARLRSRPNTVVTAMPIHLYPKGEERY